jgi:hypothetical protein
VHRIRVSPFRVDTSSQVRASQRCK